MHSQFQIQKLESVVDQNLGRQIFDETWALDSGSEITPNL